VPLCADSKLYYERYCPYSLIDGELASTSEADDSCAIDQQTSEADQLILTDDSKSLVSHVLVHFMAACQHSLSQKFRWPLPPQIQWPKTRFRTTLQLDPKYLQNATKHRQSEKVT